MNIAEFIDGYDVDVVKAKDFSNLPIDEIMECVRDFVGEEGVVVRFEDGHMLKIKGSWYVAIHKAKDDILYERNVVRLILDEKLDDVLSFVLDVDRQRLTAFQDTFLRQTTHDMGIQASYSWADLGSNLMSRKEWAIKHAKDFGPFASIVFRLLDRGIQNTSVDIWVNEFGEAFKQLIFSKTTSNSTWDAFKKGAGFTFDYNSAVPTE